LFLVFSILIFASAKALLSWHNVFVGIDAQEKLTLDYE